MIVSQLFHSHLLFNRYQQTILSALVSEHMNTTMLSEDLLPDVITTEESNIYDETKRDDLWEKVFPFEIIFVKSVVKSNKLLNIMKICYLLGTVTVIVLSAILMNKGEYNEYIGDEVPLSMSILLHLEGIALFLLPIICLWFSRIVVASSDVNHLIAYALKHDTHIKLKLAIFTHLNCLCLVVAFFTMFLAVHYDDSIIHVILVTLYAIVYFGPLNFVVSLAVCLIELHRSKIQLFRRDIEEVNSALENQLCSQNRMGMKGADSTLESAQVSDYMLNVSNFNRRYYQLYTMCLRTSKSCGFYFLFFLTFGGVYAFATIYSIYLGFYPTRGLLGFVFVGLVMLLGLGAILTACNETGNCLRSFFCRYFNSTTTI